MNHAVFGETMENVIKHRDIKLLTNEGKKNYLVLEPNYDATNFFFRKLISHRNEKKTTICE